MTSLGARRLSHVHARHSTASTPDFTHAYPLIHELKALAAVATLAACTCEIWLVAALRSFTLTVRHKPGANLIFANALSRTHASPAALDFVTKYCASHNITRVL